MSIVVRKLREYADGDLLLGWDPVPGAEGYQITHSLSTKKPHTWDPNVRRDPNFPACNTRVQGGAEWYRVREIELDEEGEYRPGEPEPDPVGVLSKPPPGYVGGDPRDPRNFPGFEVVEIDGPGSYCPSLKPYFLKVNAKWDAPPSGGRSSIQILSGSHIVAVAGNGYGEASVVPTTNSVVNASDPTAFLFEPGDPAGEIYFEGFHIDRCVNGFTSRTNRRQRFAFCRISECRAKDDVTSQAHPDPWQGWAGGEPPEVVFERFTCYSAYTGISVLLYPGPLKMRLDKVDIHALRPLSGSDSRPLIMGNAVYLNSGNTPRSGRYTAWEGEAWVESGYVNATVRRPLDGVVILKYIPGQQGAIGLECWPYEIVGINGESFTSPLNPTGGTAPSPLGSRQGDRLTFKRTEHFKMMSFLAGRPPASAGGVNGEFVPRAKVGAAYEPLMYL